MVDGQAKFMRNRDRSLFAAMHLSSVVPKEDLIAIILYCGPYDLKGLYDSKAGLPGFSYDRSGWAYFGIRHWRDTPYAAQAAVIDHVAPSFPPAFITDGSTGSFEQNARKLETRLKATGAYVESLYYPAEHGTINHEYQFDFS